VFAMKIPYYFINFVFLLAASTGYSCHRIVSIALGIAAWLLFPVAVFLFRIDPLNAVLPVIIFNCLLAAFAEANFALRQNVLEWGSVFCREEYTKNALMEDSLGLESFENGMKFKELEIVSLYDITRKMSEGLRLEAVLEPFALFLKENFDFTGCELLVLKDSGDGARLDRRYEAAGPDAALYQSPLRGSGTGQLDYDNLIRFFIENPKEHFIPGEEGRSLAGIPLMSEKTVYGILLIENLQKNDLEKFVILSMQFALEMKKALLYETVEKLAITDSLTGLYLRRYFSERLEDEIKRSGKHRLNFALLEIDIDDFKICNDKHGHLSGDAVLKETARLIKEGTREIDIVSRYGGEEFAVLLEETDEKGAMIVAERIREKVKECQFKAYDEILKITVSVGVAAYPKDAKTKDALFEKADRALYEAKKSGKNVVRKFGI
jgi:diguanylate cyclase (GGDEF)-like protein